MSKLVRGKNVFAQIEIDSVFYPIFCAKSATFIDNMDEIETTHINSGADREFVPGLGDKMVEVDGITTTDNTNGRISIVYLLQAAQRRQIFSMRWIMTNEDAEVVAITFSAFIRNASISRDIASFSQSAISFRVTGPIDIDTSPAPPEPPACEVEDPLYIDVVAGQTSVSSVLLQETGVEILSVARSGAEHYYTAGTPGSLQYTTNLVAGTVSFDPTNPFNSGEVIYILYKIN